MKYRIGLDIGIASVGWSVIEHNDQDEPTRIVDLGVRTFSSAENPKDGSSLAVDRRNARGLRRRLRRRADRIEKAKTYLTKKLLNGKEDSNINRDIFQLRCKALDEKIENEELYSVILYLIKHRGFKSNRKSEELNKEGGQLTKSIEDNNKFMLENGYRTVGECIYKSDRFFKIDENGKREYNVRNHPIGVNGSYKNCFGRPELEKELITILNVQQKLGNTNITEEFKDYIVSLFNKQRSFDEGPNEPSKYKASFVVGKDILFEPEEYRAPKGSFTFEYCNALQKINNLHILKNGEKLALNEDQRSLILQSVEQGKSLTYAQIRKLLKLQEDELFNGLSYYVKKKQNEPALEFKDILEKCEKAKFFEFQFTKAVCKELQLENYKANRNLIDAIGFILSMRKSDIARIEALKGNDVLLDRLSEDQVIALQKLSEDDINALLPIDTSKFGNLSFKSMNKIIPFLEQGHTYDKACDLAGYSFTKAYGKNKGKKIVWANLEESLQEVTSPVVLRSISQTVKVVNAIIDKYGSPCAVFVELAREMSKNFDERRKIQKDNENRQQNNEKIVQKIKEMGIIPSGQDIVKYRLYEEQNGKCAYSGKSFDDNLGGVQNIFTNATQVDHIVPYSKCFDDSYNNKVLVLAEENQKKGNKLPYQYMSEDQFAKFEEFVVSTYKNNSKKMQRLLKHKLSEEECNELNNRALNDTKHCARFVMNMLKDNLEFENSKLSKSPVRAVNGAMTSYLRKLWGINKIRFENDRHHAVDATIIACCTAGAINLVSKYLQFKAYRENRKQLKYVVIDGEKKYADEDGVVISSAEYDKLFGPKIPTPYQHFVNELELRSGIMATTPYALEKYQQWGYEENEIQAVRELFVSRMPTRKVKGQIHAQTIRRLKQEEQITYAIAKTNLTDLKMKDGKIEGYFEANKNSDPLLYNALLKRINEFSTLKDGKVVYDMQAAFSTPFYKPKTNGENGPIVKKVKIAKQISNYVELKNKAVADSGGMVRIDVFEKDNKNYFVPIYVADVYKGILPNKAATAGKSKKDWREIDDSYTFKFSLYPNDLIYVQSNKGIKGKRVIDGKPILQNEVFGYYISANISTAAIQLLKSQDSAIDYEGVGLQSVKLEKYTVDILGNISKVKNEKRMPFSLKKN